MTIKGLAAARLRFVMTGLAVVLGTAFVAGAMTLGDTLEDGFEDLFTQIAGAADVQVRVDSEADEGAGPPGVDDPAAEREGMPPELLEDVRALDEVAIADGEIEGSAILIGDDGEAIGEFGPPTLAYNVFDEPSLDPAELRDGRWPERDGEIVIDAAAAEGQGWQVGDEVEVVLDGPAETVELVGIFGLGDLDNLAGATVVVLDRETAAERLGTGGDLTAIYANAADGTSPDELTTAVQEAVGDAYEVRTAEDVAAEDQEAIAEFTQIFSYALLVFAGVSLLVGAFLIFNTFSIVLAQRLRELALLRAVGAGRGQLLASVLGEAAILGLGGGALGALAGLGVAAGLQQLLEVIGLELPGSGLVVLPRTAIVAIGVGLVVTLVAALVPARRAVRVPPVAALQEVAVGSSSGRRWPRVALGGLLSVTGAAGLAAGIVGEAGIAVAGGGAVAMILGAAALSSLIARPLAGGLGWPLIATGPHGALARLNAMRSPRRTAATASALMIGLALVGFVGIFAESLRASASDAIERVFAADVILQATTATGVTSAALDEVEALDETRLVAPMRAASLEVAGDDRFVGVMEADELLTVFDLEAVDGEFETFRDGGLLVAESAADDLELAAGDTIAVGLPDGEADVPVATVVDGSGLDVQWLLAQETYGDAGDEAPLGVYVALADGVAGTDGVEAVSAALDGYPQVTVLDRAGLVEQLDEQLGQLVAVVVALLALSVLIALLGITNTLALSVVERVREIGLLRAVGMGRRQVRAMVRGEAGIVSLLGAALGLALGLVFGVAFVEAAEGMGVSRLVVPWTQVAIGLVLAAVAGVVAGALPARRAARLDVLDALHQE
ncbi:ABC transporter permease [Egibacter rhizosphaerae]|uniref:ABC transporter permease n=1 Tax=Egibacter rhizosphaerae TaxID=1670831 RepID=UPI0013F14725|nr:FtsX-like permease family protein [Egibacter rhizosphaerae]